MNAFWIVFVAVAAGTLILNLIVSWRRRERATFVAYAADPNRYSWFSLSASMVGTIVGGGMFLATSQMGYEAGVVGYVLGLVYLVGMILMGSLVERMRTQLDDHGSLGIMDLVESAFSRRMALLFAMVSLALYFFLLAAQFVAIYEFSTYLGQRMGSPLAIWSLAVIAVIILFLYPIVGGLRKDIQTDILQFILICLAGAVVVYHLAAPREPFSPLQLPPELLTGRGYGLVFLIGMVVFYTPSFLVRADFWQRVRAGRSAKDVKVSFMVAGILSMLFFVLFTTLGMWARATDLGRADVASLDIFLREIRSPAALGLVLGAFFAAVLSSADTFINNCSLFALRLLPVPQSGGDQADRRQLFRSRVLGVSVIVVSILIAFSVPDFVDLLVGALSLLLVFLPMVFGLFARDKVSEPATFWSVLLGVAVFAFLFWGWDPKLAFAPAVLSSLLLHLVLRFAFRR